MKKAIEIKDLVKTYQKQFAVNHISFDIEEGTIFGLLGPNGAGKTTLIRMITGILIPDSGSVSIHGNQTNLVNNARFIGYMPEERGLYKKMKAEEQAIYLAQLKGLSYSQAKEKVKYWFDRLDMNDWKTKKIDEISKGMGQKLQFVCTVVHDPSIIILDEPFSGLDPLNADIIKNEIYQLSKKGATIIFSTHRMEQVEEICKHIVLIDKGQVILNDTVINAKNRFKQNIYSLSASNISDIVEKPLIFSIIEKNDANITLKLAENVNSSDFLKEMISQKIDIHQFADEMPNLNHIFIQLVQNHAN